MIREYLRMRRTLFLLWAAAGVTSLASAAAYGAGMEAAQYGLLMLTFLLALFCAADFLRFRARARRLDEVLRNLSEARHSLPEAVGPIEARYHALADGLYALLAAQKEALETGDAEQLEYYTLWVHQIKTPIAAMRLAMQSGARPELLEAELFKVERYVEMALQNVKLGSLAGDLVIREEPLEPIVRECVRKYAPLFIAKHLSVQMEQLERTVTTDSKWLAFILEQLLSNAVKYTHAGGVRIACEGEWLVVEDTGVGIRAEDLQRVFEKGYTGHNGRMDKRASGLGLYMASRAARALGIRLRAESEPGQGTRMLLRFPVRNGDIQ